MANSNYGLGNILMGASKAFDKIKNDSRVDELYEQKQQDRAVRLADAEYARQRKRLADERADTKYERDEDAYRIAEQSKNVMRQIGLNNDPSGLVELYKGIGVDVDIQPTGDGKATIITKDPSGKVIKQVKEMDELGRMAAAFSNPESIIKFKNEMAKERLAAQNAMKLEKLKQKGMTGREIIKGEYSLEAAGIKAKGKDSKGGDTSLKDDKYFRDYGKTLYGKSNGLDFFVDKTDKYARFTDAATAFWQTGNYANRNEAGNAAFKWVNALGEKAMKRAKQELSKVDTGDLSDDEWVNKRAQAILDAALEKQKQRITSTKSDENSSVPRGTSGASEQPQATITADEYRQRAKQKGWPDDVIEKKLREAVASGKVQAGETVPSPEKTKNPPIQAPQNAADTDNDGDARVDTDSDGDGSLAKAETPVPDQSGDNIVAMAAADEQNAPIEEDLHNTAKKPFEAIESGLGAVAEGFGKKRDNSMDDLIGQVPKFSNDPKGQSARRAYEKKVRYASKLVKQRLRSKRANLKGLSPELVRLALQDPSLIRTLSKKTKGAIRQYLNNQKKEKTMLAQNS